MAMNEEDPHCIICGIIASNHDLQYSYYTCNKHKTVPVKFIAEAIDDYNLTGRTRWDNFVV